LELATTGVSSERPAVATERLARLDRRLAALPSTRRGVRVRLRARASILAMSEALARHAIYFDAGAAR